MLIREAKETDIPNLLVLMKELARFERYIDTFAVTEENLLEQGFRRSPPDFYCFVAEEAGELTGMVVYYFILFTAVAKPTLFIKELFVAALQARLRSLMSHAVFGIGLYVSALDLSSMTEAYS